MVKPTKDNNRNNGVIFNTGHHLNHIEFGKWRPNLFLLSGSIFVSAFAQLNSINLDNWSTLLNHETFLLFLLNPLINRLPWEQHTYIGYVGDIIFECLVGAAFFICNGSFILFFISICLHLKAFSKMFQHSTLEMNRPDQNCNNKKFLAELIQFHMTIRRQV